MDDTVSRPAHRYDAFFRRATRDARRPSGQAPYAYQRQIADEGLPPVLHAPTGAGKTAAMVLGWAWRRCAHPEQAVREATPRRLVFALPMRVLVEQTATAVREWLSQLDLCEQVGVHVLMGGEEDRDHDWRLTPDQPAVLVGTIDMLLSRALQRGYGESRFAWPVSFGLLSNDTHWVLDEVQLLGPALATCRQLDAFRASLGTALPSSTTYMSATVARQDLVTVDAPEVPEPVAPTKDDEVGVLGERLQAAKRVEGLSQPRDEKLHLRAVADAVRDRHSRGTRTIVVVNTVRRAQDVHAALTGTVDADLLLVHSRFRPRERQALQERLRTPVDVGGPGQIVVATQVIEAGVDVSARMLVTELAPWSSIVQRAGRCNRYAEADDAQLVWLRPPVAAPYQDEQLDEAAGHLARLDGTAVTPQSLAAIAPAPSTAPVQVLRRRDLIALFDTTPDLSGNDIDVGRFIRDSEDLDVLVAWRPPHADGSPRPVLLPAPGREELCPVPVGQAREWLRVGRATAWRHDVRAPTRRQWAPLQASDLRTDLRPGMVLVVLTADGGYDPDSGWSPASRTAVEPVMAATDELQPIDEGIADDTGTAIGRWVPLAAHLADAAAAAESLVDALGAAGLPAGTGEAIVRAAALHDVGKAHPIFQNALVALEDEASRGERALGGPWAKSGRTGRLRFASRGFRHEFAGALALLDEGASAVEDLAEMALCRYLVAAHHGRVRLGARALPEEDDGRVLGILEGGLLPAVVLPEGVAGLQHALPTSALHPSALALGGGWTAGALALRDRSDLGPFRLAWCEAMVRIADWQASRLERDAGTTREVSGA